MTYRDSMEIVELMRENRRLHEALELALATLEYMGGAEQVVDAIRNGELSEFDIDASGNLLQTVRDA